MKGTVLDFSTQTNRGVISGDDNHHYNFTGQQWKNHSPPARGSRVDFDIDPNSKQALSIYLAIEPQLKISSHRAEQDYNLIDWTKKCFSHYANFSGRARRKEYWLFYLTTIIIGLILQLCDSLLNTDRILVGIWNLVTVLPILAAGARRLHDTGRSGWWQLLILTVIGAIPLIIFLASDTQQKNNKWGVPAK